jgi:hypothetical protein
MHERINRLHGARVEAELAAFRAEARPGLKNAEKLFLKEFRSKVKEVEKLHRDWDANHVFMPPASEPTEE